MTDKAGTPGRPQVRRGGLRKAFVGTFLDAGYRPRAKLRTNAAAAAYLQRMALSDLGGVPIVASAPRTDEKVARTMAAEFIAAVTRSGGKSAMHWYTDSIDRMVALATMMHPEVGDDEVARAVAPRRFSDSRDARTVLFCAMAITSQNVPVHENMGYAMEQYRAFVATGRFRPKGYGIRGASVMKNLERFNHLLDVVGGDLSEARAFLGTKFRMGDLRASAQKVGLTVGGRELNDEAVWGSMIFGPKIGNGFYQNLIGNHAPVTIDLWFMRTWGRYTGTLVKHAVSDAQVERLAATLANLGEPYLSGAVANGHVVGADPLGMEPEDLLAACRTLTLAWERVRRDMGPSGMDNATISDEKARLGWPGAAASIVKSLSATVDQPENAGQRRWIRTVVARTLEILAEHGYAVTAADLQAGLWYPEKQLYQHIVDGKVTNLYNVAYDEALVAIARKEGHPDDRIEAALRSVGAHRPRGQGGPGTVGRGDGAPVQGLRDGPDADGRSQGDGRAGRGRAAPREVRDLTGEVPSEEDAEEGAAFAL